MQLTSEFGKLCADAESFYHRSHIVLSGGVIAAGRKSKDKAHYAWTFGTDAHGPEGDSKHRGSGAGIPGLRRGAQQGRVQTPRKDRPAAGIVNDPRVRLG